MPNAWGDSEVNQWGDPLADEVSATNEWGDVAVDTERDAPKSSAVVDVVNRTAKSALTSTGGAIASTARLYKKGVLDRIDAANDRLTEIVQGFPLTDEQKATRAKMRAEEDTSHEAIDFGEGMQAGARTIETDPARDKELKSKVAEIGGAVIPVVGAGLVNPVAGFGMAVGEGADAARSGSLAAGDSPELADEKMVLGAAAGAPLAIAPAGPVRGAAGMLERLATRAATGGALNAGGDAAAQKLTEGKVDWGRVGLNGAIGAGLGVVLGVHEALALRKALGTQGSHEGKTLGQAVTDIAAEKGQTPTDVQARINQMVGVEAEPAAGATRDARQAELEGTLSDRAAEESSAAQRAAGDAAQSKTLFESRTRRQADLEAALADRDAQMAEEMARNQVGPGQSSESTAWLHEGDAGRQAEAGVTSLDSKLGKGAGAARERARLEKALPADSPLRDTPASADETGPELSPQARRMADQYGGIDIKAMMPLARAAIGGSIGYAAGDTPEERVRNGLIGIGAGAAASPALVSRLTRAVFSTPVGRQAQEVFRAKWQALQLRVAPQSMLPQQIRTQLRWGEQAVQAVTSQGLSLTRDLERAIYSTGPAPARAAAAQVAKDFLDGKLPASAVPAPVRMQAQKVRDFVDALTDRAVAEGVVSGQLATTFLTNRGSYLRRSYDIFLNPNYKPTPATTNAAISAIEKSNGITRPEAEGIVAGILDKNSRAGLSDFLLGRGKVAGKDVSSLVKRKDLLPEVRELLGEVKDPILAANQTIPRMARLIEHDAAQKQVRAIGMNLGLFSDTRSLAAPTPVVAEGSATHDVLAGLYSRPEIAAALQREAGLGRTAFVPEVLWKTLTTASTLAKTTKTVLNPESYAPNFIGGIIANVGNANFRYNHAARGLALGAEELGALRQFLPSRPGRTALRAELTELQKLGVVGESINSGDLLRAIDSSFFGRLADRTKSVLTIPSKIYGMTDDFNRYIAWQSERARYAKAFPGMAADDLKRHAAEVVRATTPIYSNVPRVIKQLSVAGMTPSFVNFTWEVFRNTKNSVQIGMRDLKQGMSTGNAALARAGAARLAAITAVVGLSSGVGISKLSRYSNKITDEQDAAVRYFSPPWNRDGMLQYHTPAAAGQPVQYSNISYLVPHALLFEAIDAGRRGAAEGRAIPEFLQALNKQFGMGNSVLIPPVVGALSGFDPTTGKQIPSTAVDPTVGDRARYLMDQAFRPLVFDWVDKFNKARTGEKGDYGRVYSEKEQMERLMGIRAQTVDPEQAMGWQAQRLGERFQHAAEIYRLQQKREAPPERLQTFYQLADTARKEQFDEMGRMLGHARALGIDDEKSIAALRAAHVPPETILGVLDGRYTPLEKDKAKTASDMLAELQATPAEKRGAALAQIYRDDPAMAKSIVDRAATEARLPGQHDKLIAGLGVADGERARYLRQKLQDLGDVASRRAFLLELRGKGLLTDRVLEQMAKP